MSDLFQKAQDHYLDAVCYALLCRENNALLRSGRGQALPYVPCPVHIGNDPCDDWSFEWDSEGEYDY